MNIAKKVLLITGANPRIGKALVHEALRRGAKRVYGGKRGRPDFADERVVLFMLDVTRDEQVEKAVCQMGSLDVLINNAGNAPYDELNNPSVIEQAFAVNLFGMYEVLCAFLPVLIRAVGAIVNNMSLMALAPLPTSPTKCRFISPILNLGQNEILSASWTCLGFALVAMIRPKFPGWITWPVFGSILPPEDVTAFKLLIGFAKFG